MSESPVDWSAVSDCYGPATTVPAMLNQLSSASATERAEAIVDLWGRLCHQGTVYEASAHAVPLLFEAAKSQSVSEADCNQLLALVVHIGLGDDTTWQGYTSWDVVERCADAVKVLLPDFAALAKEGPREARRWTLALGAYHPEAWAALGVDVADLLGDVDPGVATLVGHALGDTLPGQALLEQVVGSDEDLVDYYEQVLSELPVTTQVRRIVLELAISERL